MSRLLSFALLLMLVGSCRKSDGIRSDNADPHQVAQLVEQLVSPVGPPPAEIKEYNGGKADMKKLNAYLKALCEGWMDPQVAKARDRLISMGTPIFPELVKHLDDKRYSYSFCSAAWVDYSVGTTVGEIMAEVVGGRLRPYGYKWRQNAHGSNGQPSFDKMMREIGAEQYADRVKNITMKEAEKEYVHWYMEKEKGYGFINPQQEQKILGPCLKRLSEL
jgi:hypothetical protein